MIGRVNTGGGTGATLTVTAPARVTVTVSKDGKTKTKVSDASGSAVFKGLSTGTWTLTITDGSQTSTKPVVITADYSAVIAFFSATINVTYPAGSTCTATDGVTVLTAPDASGVWACVVPNAGTWMITITYGEKNASKSVNITSDAQTESISLSYSYIFQELNAANWVVTKSPHRISVVDSNGGIKIKYKSGGWEEVQGYINEPVDLTEYSKVVLSGTNDPGAATIQVVVYESDKSTISSSVTLPVNTISALDEYPIDCSELSGLHYIGIHARVGVLKAAEHTEISAITAT